MIPARAASATEQLQRDGGAGLGVGQGVVVVLEDIAALQGDGLQPVVGQLPAKVPSRGAAGAGERVAGIVEAVMLMRRPQAGLVERAVVRDQRQPGDPGCQLPPDVGEGGRIGGVGGAESVDLRVEGQVEVRRGADESVERLDDRAAPDNDDPDTADARAPLVGGLEIDGGKIEDRSPR